MLCIVVLLGLTDVAGKYIEAIDVPQWLPKEQTQGEPEITQHRDLRSVGRFNCQLPDPGTCDFNSSYRTADGSCNNRDNPSWGMAGMIQVRFIENDYDDKQNLPRSKGVRKTTLPNPRNISNELFSEDPNTESFSSEKTHFFVFFGQFLDHDITLTPESNVTDCCTEANDECFNIIITEDDAHFRKGDCMEFKRSEPVFCPNTPQRKIRQQINAITSFIDASNVYGSSEEEGKQLRTEDGNGFLLKTATGPDQKVRIANGPNDRCEVKLQEQKCSFAGDARANEAPPLTVMHLLMVKEHNRIAEKLKGFFPDDEEEKIFQETRKIIGAVMQKITYDEFLPCLLSPTIMEMNKLETKNVYEYEEGTNPTIINSFSAAAFRFGHSMVPKKLELFDKDLMPLNPRATRRLKFTFLDPDLTYGKNAFSRLAYGLVNASSKFDRFLVEDVRDSLFNNTKNGTQSFDLGARNIQRGRDHGLPSYHKFRKACRLKGLKRNWGKNGNDAGLTDHTDEVQKKLQNIFDSPWDIDLFVGGLSETPVEGGLLGPTFQCIIAEQFRRLKVGDRLFFQNKDAGFTQAQIEAIQAYSLPKILCNNYAFEEINHPNAFRLSDERKRCSEIADLDFKVFKQNNETHDVS